MAQEVKVCVKACATKPDGPSSLSRTHSERGELAPASCPLTSTHTLVHTTHTTILIGQSLKNWIVPVAHYLVTWWPSLPVSLSSKR